MNRLATGLKPGCITLPSFKTSPLSKLRNAVIMHLIISARIVPLLLIDKVSKSNLKAVAVRYSSKNCQAATRIESCKMSPL